MSAPTSPSSSATAPERGPALPGRKIADSLVFHYTDLFYGLEQNAHGCIEGPTARQFLVKSNLPPSALMHIWQLVDTLDRGALNLFQFIIVMELCRQTAKGAALPPQLDDAMAAMLAESDAWSIGKEQIAKYVHAFRKLDAEGAGKVGGAKASSFMQTSGLPRAALRKIWSLSDTQQSGALTPGEFVLAMHLVNLATSAGESAVPKAVAPAIMRLIKNINDSFSPLSPAGSAGSLSRQSSTNLHINDETTLKFPAIASPQTITKAPSPVPVLAAPSQAGGSSRAQRAGSVASRAEAAAVQSPAAAPQPAEGMTPLLAPKAKDGYSMTQFERDLFDLGGPAEPRPQPDAPDSGAAAAAKDAAATADAILSPQLALVPEQQQQQQQQRLGSPEDPFRDPKQADSAKLAEIQRKAQEEETVLALRELDLRGLHAAAASAESAVAQAESALAQLRAERAGRETQVHELRQRCEAAAAAQTEAEAATQGERATLAALQAETQALQGELDEAAAALDRESQALHSGQEAAEAARGAAMQVQARIAETQALSRSQREEVEAAEARAAKDAARAEELEETLRQLDAERDSLAQRSASAVARSEETKARAERLHSLIEQRRGEIGGAQVAPDPFWARLAEAVAGIRQDAVHWEDAFTMLEQVLVDEPARSAKRSGAPSPKSPANPFGSDFAFPDAKSRTNKSTADLSFDFFPPADEQLGKGDETGVFEQPPSATSAAETAAQRSRTVSPKQQQQIGASIWGTAASTEELDAYRPQPSPAAPSPFDGADPSDSYAAKASGEEADFFADFPDELDEPVAAAAGASPSASPKVPTNLFSEQTITTGAFDADFEAAFR